MQNKHPAREIFARILATKRNESQPGAKQPIVDYNEGQPVARQSEDEPTVAVAVPKAVEFKDGSFSGEVTQTEVDDQVVAVDQAVPEAVAKADDQIEKVVEEEIRLQGGDVAEMEAETGEKNELRVERADIATVHGSFVRAQGEATTGDASNVEEVWDPLEEVT